MYKPLFVLLFFCLSQTCAGQQPGYLFHPLEVKDGLNQQNTFSVCQDKRGFLWMAFQNGIQRYDGHRFLNFYTGRNNILPSGRITSMGMDKKGRLWVVISHATLGYFDTDKFTWQPVKISLPSSFTDTGAGLLIDKEGNIMLVFVGRGFLTYNEKTNEVAQQNNPFIIPPGYEPRHMVQDDDFNYWVCSANGFLKYNTKKKLLSYAGSNKEKDPFIAAFAHIKNTGVIYTDLEKRIWVTYWHPGYSISSFDPSNGKTLAWETVIAKNLNGASYNLWGINPFSDGSIWMNGPGLLAKVNYEQHGIEQVIANASHEYGIRYDVASYLFEDREKSIWACTNKGLYRFNPSAQTFRVINNKLPGDDKLYYSGITSFLETADGEILVSTNGDGIFCYDNNFHPVPSKYIRRQKNEAVVWCMLQTKNGDIWRGGQDGQMFIYESATKKNIRLVPEICNNQSIWQMVGDKHGNIWLGTQGGRLIKWRKEDKKFYLQQQFRRPISKLFVDSKNNIWAGTDMDGVFCIKEEDGTVLEHYTATGRLNKKMLVNGASDITGLNDSTMVIAANGLNLLHTKTGHIICWDEGDEIKSMINDKSGNLWLASYKGIVCRQMDKEWMHITFDARDGVTNFDFINAAGLALNNGHILFGANHDFITFDPIKAMTFNFTLPEIQIAEIAVMNKKLSVDSVRQKGQLNLTQNQNSFSIKFTTNNFQTISPVVYMIEGIDKDFKNSSNGEVNLNYMAPGRYILKAATKGGGGEVGKITSLTIVIAAPFYKTWWFLGLLALALIGLLFWFDKQRLKRKEAIHKIRSNIANNLHKDVNTVLQNINILSEMAKIKADKDIGKSKEFIEQIHGKSHNMMIAMDDMLWSIDPANDNMDKTILRMQEFIEALNNRNDIHISMMVDEKVKKLKLPMQLRHDAFILFRESIRKTTAAGANQCSVHLAHEKNNLLFTIQCNNKNCDLEKLNNLLQAAEMEQRINNVGASLHTEEDKYNMMLLMKVPV